MDEINTLDLLKSLTLGVNNKINQEQDSEIEYIVDTSLSNKKKKSAPPIVKEVVKEKKSDILSEDFLDTEDFYESEIVEESFDTVIENEIFVEECVDDILAEVEEEPFISEEIVETDIFIEDDVLNSDAVDFIDSGHISEELVESKKKDKIQRNGNPFKRGPRKKKDKTQKVEKSPVIVKEPESIISEEIIVEDTVRAEETVILAEVNNEIEPDYLDELQTLDDSEFDSLFSEDIEDEEVIEGLKNVDEEVGELADIDIEDDDFTESFEIEVENESFEDESLISVGVKDALFEETTKIVEEVNEVNTTSEFFSEKNDLDFLNSFSESESNSPKEREDAIKEETSISDNKNEDEKFKNCVYYKGMSVEDFLRENPNYREALYVEHFFSKEELNKLIVSGLLLIKKGKYRL